MMIPEGMELASSVKSVAEGSAYLIVCSTALKQSIKYALF